MMPKLEYFLVADSVSTDQARNTVSFFHVLEEWTAPLPLVIPRLVAVSSWKIAPEDRGHDFQVTLDIHLPGGQQLPEGKVFPINFTPDKPRHRTYHFVTNLCVESEGDLVFEILINGQHAGNHTVWIHAGDATD